MNDSLITVATFNFTTDPTFLLFKAALDHHDIPYFAAEENTLNANPFLSISVGGIRVQVREADLPEAVRIWREIKEVDEAQTLAEDHSDFGEYDYILDDMRSRTTLQTNPAPVASNISYALLVAIIIGGLLLAILVAILLEL